VPQSLTQSRSVVVLDAGLLALVMAVGLIVLAARAALDVRIDLTVEVARCHPGKRKQNRNESHGLLHLMNGAPAGSCRTSVQTHGQW
jgi:hypothetical protein